MLTDDEESEPLQLISDLKDKLLKSIEESDEWKKECWPDGNFPDMLDISADDVRIYRDKVDVLKILPCEDDDPILKEDDYFYENVQILPPFFRVAIVRSTVEKMKYTVLKMINGGRTSGSFVSDVNSTYQNVIDKQMRGSALFVLHWDSVISSDFDTKRLWTMNACFPIICFASTHKKKNGQNFICCNFYKCSLS
jgi:hypothetical protein